MQLCAGMLDVLQVARLRKPLNWIPTTHQVQRRRRGLSWRSKK